MRERRRNMRTFRPKLFETLRNYSGKQFVNDLVAGVIVAIIALPLSIALAIASGVSPEKGLYTAIVAGFVISFLGGSRVNISGPTAAFATIVAGVVAQFGTDGLVIATVMAGIMLIIMGVCRFGALIKYIPHTITTGFTSGVAVTIVVGQLKDFLGVTYPEGTHAVETMEKLAAVGKSLTTVNLQAVLVGLLGLIVLIVWPKINQKIPGSLIAVLVGVAVVKLMHLDVNTIGDLYTISSTAPRFALPQVSFAAVKQLLPSAFTIAILASIESLLSCVVSDSMINDRHHSNTELIAQGLGNVCSGLFGGIPATGAIARTAANVKNGGRTPVAGMIHAAVLLLILMVLMPYAAWIPMPIIASILFMVAYNMCEWRQFVKICKTAPKSDIVVLVLTFVLTVVFDLVVAIEVGLVVTLVLFLKRMTAVTDIRLWEAREESRHLQIPEHTKIYEIDGPLFFATTDKLLEVVPDEKTQVVIFRMSNLNALDESALRELESVCAGLRDSGVRVIFSHVHDQPMHVMKKAGFYSAMGEENFVAHIEGALALAEAANETEHC